MRFPNISLSPTIADTTQIQQPGKWNLAWILFSLSGRIDRRQFWAGYLSVILTYFLWNLFPQGLDAAARHIQVIAADFVRVAWLFPVSWIVYAVTTKRYHDRNKSGWWCLLYLIPVIGPLVVIGECGLLVGIPEHNKYDESGELRKSEQIAARSFLVAAGANAIAVVTAIALTDLWLSRCPGCDDHIGEPGAGALLAILLALALFVTSNGAGIVASVITKLRPTTRWYIPMLVGTIGSVPLLLVCLWLVDDSQYSDRDSSWTAAEVRVYVAADADILRVRYHDSPIACHTRRKSKGRSKLIDERGYIYVILDNGCSGYVTQDDLLRGD